MNKPGPSSRRWLIRAVKLGVIALIVWGVHRTVEAAVGELEDKHWSPAELRPGWLVLAALFYLAGNLPSGLFWWQIMGALGQRPGVIETLRAYYIGHLGKYVPGKALVVVMRAGMMRSERVDTTVAAVAVFYETLTTMASGAFVGGATLAIWHRHQTMLMLAALGMMVCAGLPTLPPVFRRLVQFSGIGKKNLATDEQLAKLGYRTLLAGWLSTGVGWLLIGASLWATLVASGFATWPNAAEGLRGTGYELIVSIAAAALAVVAGFASFIPGGAFVRELVLMELLSVPFGVDGALVLALVVRLLWLVAEGVISGILYGVRMKQKG